MNVSLKSGQYQYKWKTAQGFSFWNVSLKSDFQVYFIEEKNLSYLQTERILDVSMNHYNECPGGYPHIWLLTLPMDA